LLQELKPSEPATWASYWSIEISILGFSWFFFIIIK
jgi:hypothetical protein